MLHFESPVGLLSSRHEVCGSEVCGSDAYDEPNPCGSECNRLDAGQRGASLVEYSLLVALIAVVCVGAVTFFGGELSSSISTAGDSLN